MSTESRAAEVVAVDTGIRMQPDPRRTVLRFFVAGREDVGPGDSRATSVIDRILALDEREVAVAIRAIHTRFADHAGLHDVFDRHAELAMRRLPSQLDLTRARRQFLGAAFTHEYAIEAASLCNPSMVLHPEQPGNGDTRFVLSVRGIGEGHRSSVGFRTGTIGSGGDIDIDAPRAGPRTGLVGRGSHHRDVLHRLLADLGDDHENARYVLDPLPETFGDAELSARLDVLSHDRATRRHIAATVAHLRLLTEASYRVSFGSDLDMSERVLWPTAPQERQGIEDVRLVRFVEDDGTPTYLGTYTAFDGTHIAQHLLISEDLATFTMTPTAGAAARGKGLAIFPRRIGGRFAALSRADRESNSLSYSDDLRCWDSAETIQVPAQSWEVLQLGNCGSPIETERGWLVLTHGVGPMRTYVMGALLLDRDHPERVLARSVEPVLTPGTERQGGYVPNVVYSCGALAHGDRLIVPYGVGDRSIAIATLSIEALIRSMRPVSDDADVT